MNKPIFKREACA